MNKEGRNWFHRLGQFNRKCRAEHPIVDWEGLWAMEEMESQIIGASLLTWLERPGPRVLQDQAMFAKP